MRFQLRKCIKCQLVKNSKKLSLENCDKIDKHFSFSVDFPEGRLESDIKKRHIDNPEKVIVNLATSYLNLASDSHILENVENIGKKIMKGLFLK